MPASQRLYPVVLLALLLASCQTPEDVAKFADESAKGVAKGPAIFADLSDSCLRRHVVDAPISPGWETRPPVGDVSACTALHEQAEALTHASSVLQGYFEAMHSLAAFGQAKNPDSTSSKNKTANDIGAASDLENVLAKAVTDARKRSELTKLLRDGDPDVQAVSDALKNAVEKQYLDVLEEERRDTEAHYSDFGKTDARNNLTLLYVLNLSYRQEMNGIRQKRESAKAYVETIATIAKGHHQLATDMQHPNVKTLSAIADSYAADIEALVGRVKAF